MITSGRLVCASFMLITLLAIDFDSIDCGRHSSGRVSVPRTPVYNPKTPVYVPKPPSHVPPRQPTSSGTSFPQPHTPHNSGSTSGKNSSHILINAEGGGRPRPGSTSHDQKPQSAPHQPSAPYEPAHKVTTGHAQSGAPTNGSPNPSDSYPPWANPSTLASTGSSTALLIIITTLIPRHNLPLNLQQAPQAPWSPIPLFTINTAPRLPVSTEFPLKVNLHPLPCPEIQLELLCLIYQLETPILIRPLALPASIFQPEMMDTPILVFFILALAPLPVCRILVNRARRPTHKAPTILLRTQTAPPAPEFVYFVPNEELCNVTEDLFAKDEVKAGQHIRLNLQKRSVNPNVTDEAPERLLNVRDEAYALPTIQAVREMYDNYEYDSEKKEIMNSDKWRQENVFLDTLLNTNIMTTAMKWLSKKGYIESDDFEWKDTLLHIWLSKVNGATSGFERIFLAEKYPGLSVIGAQNWIYFDSREWLRKINYMSYVEKIDLGAGSKMSNNFVFE